MTREQWLHKYNTDPDFRLKRLETLRRRNYKKQGGFPHPRAYQTYIDQTRLDLDRNGEDE